MVMGHNSWESYANFASWNVMLDIQPEQGSRILMQCAPGYIWSGSDFFVTSAGLVGCETSLYGFSGFDEAQSPTFQRVRKAMQYADSIDRWVEILNEQNNGGYANSWLLGDINTGEIARFEQGMLNVSFEKITDGYYSGFNAATSPLVQQECGGWSADSPANFSGARRIRWEQLMEEYKGMIDVASAEKMLGEHFDAYLEVEEPSQRTLCGHYTYQEAPSGAIDGKVVDSALAGKMTIQARWGRPCGIPIVAEDLLLNPQFEWLRGFLPTLLPQVWTTLGAGVP